MRLRSIGPCALFIPFSLILGAELVENQAPLALRPGVSPGWQDSSTQGTVLKDRQHVLIELAGPLTLQVKTSLGSQGVEIREWREGSIYHATVRRDGTWARQAMADPSLVSSLGLLAVAAVPDSVKISPILQQPETPDWIVRDLNGQAAIDVIAVLYSDVAVEDALPALRRNGWAVFGSSTEFKRIRLHIPEKDLRTLASCDFVLAVEPAPPPKVELDNVISAELIKAQGPQAAPYNLTGKGIKAGIWDSERVAAHNDLRGRLTILERSYYVSEHATHVAGTLAGSGESDAALRGIAPESMLYSGTFEDDVAAKTLAAAKEYKVTVSNNSWGYGFYGSACNLIGDYLTESRDYDKMVKEQPLSVVFAMGNDRDGYACPVLPTRAGFYSTGIPASAKNVISVAAVDRNKGMSTFSGYGPTRDGRLKPDISAMGVGVRSLSPDGGSMTASGTSMAAPAITGALALMGERFADRHSVTAPDPALMKSILLNSARDLGNIGPDYVYGYGLADVAEAVKIIDEQQFATGSLSADAWEKTISVPAGVPALRVMIAWSDEPGVPNRRATLVNDLDLSLSGPGLESAQLPLTLDPKLPAEPARPAVNRRDNVEQVVVLNPQGGEYTIRVASHRITTESQSFAVSWGFSEVEVPLCSTVASPNNLQAGQAGGSTAIGVTRPSHCAEVELENPSRWVTTSQQGPVKGTTAVKVNVAPADSEGTRYTMLRIDKAEMRVRQSGPCALKPLPENGEVADELGIYDCLTYSEYTRQYSFQAQAGQKVRITMTAPDYDCELALRAPDGSVMMWSSYDTFPLAAIPSQGMLTLPMTGTYVVSANSLDNATGPFTMKVTFGEVESVEGQVDAPKLITECPFTGEGALGDSSSSTGRRGELYRTDAYLFKAYAGQRIDIKVTKTDFDSYLYLISPTGSLVAVNDDVAGEEGSRLNPILSEGGQWRIEVTSFAPFVSGRYEIEVRGCPAPPTL